MINSKQRAMLRGMANTMEPIMQVGKGGISENLISTVSDALEARELIKMKALENSGETARDIAEALAEATGADVVCVIGTRFVLYRESKKKKVIFAESTKEDSAKAKVAKGKTVGKSTRGRK